MCYEYGGMFLAKVWKTVNGTRYPGWVLKKSVWDKDEKRQKQVYVGYIGANKQITLGKAKQLCRDKGLTLEELRQVKGLEVAESTQDKATDVSIDNPLRVPPQRREQDIAEGLHADPDVGFDVPEATLAEMVRELREHYGLGDTLAEYDDLAYKISPSLEAETLRLVEQDRAVLDGATQKRLRDKWRWATGRSA